MAHKIVTCCYCGTRAALVLDQGRHELSCSACGAPLHEMKALPRKKAAAGAPGHAPAGDKRRKGRRKVKVDWEAERAQALREMGKPVSPRRPKRRGKPRKSLGRKLWGEFVDAIEDIFD
jgi:hypothetical protein